jgi:hypothetical protein
MIAFIKSTIVLINNDQSIGVGTGTGTGSGVGGLSQWKMHLDRIPGWWVLNNFLFIFNFFIFDFNLSTFCLIYSICCFFLVFIDFVVN